MDGPKPRGTKTFSKPFIIIKKLTTRPSHRSSSFASSFALHFAYARIVLRFDTRRRRAKLTPAYTACDTLRLRLQWWCVAASSAAATGGEFRWCCGVACCTALALHADALRASRFALALLPTTVIIAQHATRNGPPPPPPARSMPMPARELELASRFAHPPWRTKGLPAAPCPLPAAGLALAARVVRRTADGAAAVTPPSSLHLATHDHGLRLRALPLPLHLPLLGALVQRRLPLRGRVC